MPAHILNKGDDYWALVNLRAVQSETGVRVALVIQGGGAKGAWQGALLDAVLSEAAICPVAALGSSAGAINAALVSGKIRSRDQDPFGPAWRRLGAFARCHWADLFDLLGHFCCDDDGCGSRRRHHLSADLLEEAMQDIFADWVCGLYTYIQACDVESPRAPTYPATGLYAFEAERGERRFATNRSRNQKQPLRTCTPAQAIGASACLPTIEPFLVGGKRLMDGGIMSNLPLEFATGSLSLGVSFNLLVLPQQLSGLDPEASFVDWNVLAALHAVKRRLRADDTFVFCLLEPSTTLRAGLAHGFFCQSLMDRDEEDGREVGGRFLGDLSAFLDDPRASVQRLQLYDLRHRTLPALPRRPPVEDWMVYANRGWGESLRNP